MSAADRNEIRDFELGIDVIDLRDWDAQSFSELKIGGKPSVVVLRDLEDGNLGIVRDQAGDLKPNDLIEDNFGFAVV